MIHGSTPIQLFWKRKVPTTDWLASSLQNGYIVSLHLSFAPPSQTEFYLFSPLRPQGQYLGTLENVNHLDLVGWINTARYKWAEITGREIKFRPATFYLGIADWLAAEVEGVEKVSDETQGEQLRGKVGAGVDVSDDVPGSGGGQGEEIDGHSGVNASDTRMSVNADPTHTKAQRQP